MTAPTIPTTSSELEETLADDKRLTAIAKNGGLGEFIKNYADMHAKKNQDFGVEVKEETQRVLAQWLKDNKNEGITPVNLNVNDPDAVRKAAGNKGLYNKHAAGAVLDKDFQGAAAFFQSIWHNADATPDNQARKTKLRNAFSTTVPSEGGFLVPEQLRADLLQLSLETSVTRPRALVIPMESQRLPVPSIDATSNVSSVFGGFVAYWTEEGGTLTESAANFGRVVLDAKKLTVYTEVPNELVSDSAISFEAFINQMLPKVIAYYEDDAFQNGTGVGEPLGWLNSPAAVAVAKEPNQAAGTIVWQNIVKMYARMLPQSLPSAVWIASIDTFPELATMALSVGTGGSAVWLNNGVVGPPMTILGRPVIFTEKSPVVGQTGDIAFADLSNYLIGDRQAMSATSSPHFKFNQDKTAFRIVERLDGRPWLGSSITPKNGGAALSPFVKIATR